MFFLFLLFFFIVFFFMHMILEEERGEKDTILPPSLPPSLPLSKRGEHSRSDPSSLFLLLILLVLFRSLLPEILAPGQMSLFSLFSFLFFFFFVVVVFSFFSLGRKTHGCGGWMDLLILKWNND